MLESRKAGENIQEAAMKQPRGFGLKMAAFFGAVGTVVGSALGVVGAAGGGAAGAIGGAKLGNKLESKAKQSIKNVEFKSELSD